MAKKPGKQPLRVTAPGDWLALVDKAIKTPKPKDGWPKPDAMPQRARKVTKKKTTKKR